jgi:hypothetical protein
MFTSSADVFRTRQAVRDLLEVVHLHRSAMPRIGVSNAGTAMIDAIVKNGGIISADTVGVYTSLQLAAALPDQDFNAFIVGTAILISDQLQTGPREEDLYWNFEAFYEHYQLADAPVRAAIMNGFRQAHLAGKSSLPREPDMQVCLTRQKADVLSILSAEGVSWLADAIQSDVDASAAGGLWVNEMKPSLSFPICIGFRYLYERPISLVTTDPENTLLIPWA